MRLEPTLEDFKDIKGVYVNAGKPISSMKIPILDLTDEETEMYHKILRSVASEGKKSLDLTLKKSYDAEALVGAVIENLKLDQNYCILYSQGVWETEEEQAPYTIIAICPVKNSKAVLKYKGSEFRGAPTGSVLSGPLVGMLCFPDYASYYFSKDKHQELIDAIGSTPKSPAEIKDAFYTALSETLGEDAFSVVAAVQSTFAGEESVIKESLCDVISDRLSGEKAELFRSAFKESQIPNLGDKVSVETSNMKAVARADNLRTQKINGEECIVIPVQDIVKLNGTSIEK